MVVLGVRVLCRCGIIIRGEEAFVNRFASSSASATAPMDPNLRIHQLQPTATQSSPVTEKAHHSCPGLLAHANLRLTGRDGNCGLAVHYSQFSSHVRRTQDGQ